MKDRIRQIMTKLGMNQKEFSETTGISASTLSSIFSGRTSATLNHANAIHQSFPQVNVAWLLFGEGEMEGSPALSAAKNDTGNALPSGNEDEPTPSLFDAAPVREVIKYIEKPEKPERKIVEIRVFFSDGTYDVFPAHDK